MASIKVTPHTSLLDGSKNDTAKKYYAANGYPVYKKDGGDFMRQGEVEELIFNKYYPPSRFGLNLSEGKGPHDLILDWLFSYGRFVRSDIACVNDFVNFIHYGYRVGGFAQGSDGIYVLPKRPDIRITMNFTDQPTIQLTNTETQKTVELPLKL